MTSSVLKFVNFDNIDAAILKKFVTKSNVAMSDEVRFVEKVLLIIVFTLNVYFHV